jgi:hypothetical protein
VSEDALFLIGMGLGAVLTCLWWLLIEAIVGREAKRQADAMGAALTPGETSGYDADARYRSTYASEQGEQDLHV